MKKKLFRNNRSFGYLYVIAAVIAIIMYHPIINYSKKLSDQIAWKTVIHWDILKKNLPPHKTAINQQQIESLQLENKLLRQETATHDKTPWHHLKVIPARIHNIQWLNNERWFITDPCKNCVAINKQGLIGRMDETLSKDTIRPITHRSSMLIARSQQSGNDYLLQGQGYHAPLLVLESDLTDYPPEIGDVLITAGLDDLYPANLAIGTVIKKNDLYLVKPFFNKHIQAQIYLVQPNV